MKILYVGHTYTVRANHPKIAALARAMPDAKITFVTPHAWRGPLYENKSDLFGSVMVRKVDGDATFHKSVRAVIDVQLASPEEDFHIWSNMRYVDRPPLVGEEAKPYLALREWTRQFYPDPHAHPEPVEVAIS